MSEIINVAEIFGENVFNDSVMQERLPKKVYKELKRTIQEGKELEQSIADVVAQEQLRKNMILLFLHRSQMERC